MNRFLTEKQLQYFTENENGIIRYLFNLNFPEISKNTDNLLTKSGIADQQELKFLFQRNKNNFAGDIKKWDKISKGLLWNLYLYEYLGFDYTDDFIMNSIDYLNKNFLMQSGGFSLGWHPLAESSLWTGEYLYLLLKLGYRGEEIHLVRKWIIENQNDDGGWFVSPVKNLSDALRFVFSGKVIKERKEVNEVKSCIFSTISCMQALQAYNNNFNSHSLIEIIDKAAFFLLNEQILFKNKLESLDGFQVNKNFQSSGVSIFGQIDMIKYLDIMSQTSYKNHQFVTSVFNYFVKEKYFEEGWLFNSTADYLIENEFRIKKNSGVDYIATIKLLKIFSRYN